MSLRAQWSGAGWAAPLREKAHLASPTRKKEARGLIGVLGFWAWHFIHLGLPLAFGAQSRLSTLQSVKAVVSATLSFGPSGRHFTVCEALWMVRLTTS